MTTSQRNYDYLHEKLALGITFEDAAREREPVCPVRAEIEYGIPHRLPEPKNFYRYQVNKGKPAQALLRHDSGRYSVVYYPSLDDSIDVRFYDYQRCYVPRRLRIPILSRAALQAIEDAENPDYMTGRQRHIAMYPGSAYHHESRVTGLRGRIVRNGQPMRWAHVTLTNLAGTQTISHTRGDDRGEFLLLLPSHAFQASDLINSFDLRVSVAGPETPPQAGTPDIAQQDPFWDLPLELVPDVGNPDNVSNGETLPAGYVIAPSSVRNVSFHIGRVLTGRDEPDFEFTLP